MHSPESTQPLAQLREASGPVPVRTMSMIAGYDRRAAPPATPAASVIGQTSTHLPQRVQASSIASTRPANAISKAEPMWFLAGCSGRQFTLISRACMA